MIADTSDIDALAADLGKVAGKMVRRAEQALEVTAHKVKDDAREFAERANPQHARRYPSTIDYDITSRVGELRADIGPRVGGVGSLGGILEDSGIRNRPQENLRRAMKNNLGDFQDSLEKAAADALGDALR